MFVIVEPSNIAMPGIYLNISDNIIAYKTACANRTNIKECFAQISKHVVQALKDFAQTPMFDVLIEIS